MTACLEQLAALYDSRPAHSRYDESVTQLEHGLQSAALAGAAGCSDAVVAAALLHDVGHLLVGHDTTTDARHERHGARYLAEWFGPGVTAPVGLHVAAKRYLCATEPRYLGALSPGSVRSLERQGGPMTVAEVEAFEQNHHFADAVTVRRFDDEAKVVGAEVERFDSYRDLLRRLTSG